MPSVRIGTVDIPPRIERAQYFRELSYLELSAMFAGPLKPSVMARWAAIAPEHSLGLVAPWVLTHRASPGPGPSWRAEGIVGEFRDSPSGQSALTLFREAVTTVTAGHAVFKSPPLFAPSMANRDQLKRFFGEVATEESLGTTRVWIPDGLWEPRAAVGFARELGVICALDPLVHDPTNPGEMYDGLEAAALYFRIDGIGHAGALRTEKLEDLAELVESYQDIDLTIAFCSPARWQDARNFKKLLAGAAS